MQTTTERITTSVTIEAPIERVWEALTTPSLIKGWFLGVDTETDWTVGSPIVHRGTYQGRPYVDKGEILAVEPCRLLRHTHWSEASGEPDIPDAYQIVSFALSERDGTTRLVVSESNLPSEEAAEVSEATWSQVLDDLRGMLER